MSGPGLSRSQRDEPPTPTEPPAGTLSGDGDRFEPTPGASFVNTLISLDHNSDGAIAEGELARGMDDLERLAADGRERDRPESNLLLQIREARRAAGTAPPLSYAVDDQGRLQISLAGGDPARPVAMEHELADHGGLPLSLMEVGETAVEHGDDPGDFYCEHMFFGAQLAASSPGSSVATNDNGEKLVGFLHVPPDRHVREEPGGDYDQGERHGATRRVVGAALGRYLDEAMARTADGPVGLLLTGYDRFSLISNNPTGDFVSHRENVDAAMVGAFGDRLLTPEGEAVFGNDGVLGVADTRTVRYRVREAHSERTRELLVTTHLFPVSDEAIDSEGDGSIGELIERHRPQAVLSMGVGMPGAYLAEHRADSGGLRRTEEGDTHTWNGSDRVQLRDNFSLARAIHEGAR